MRKRFIIKDPIFHAWIYVQLGGKDQEAIDWFSRDQDLEKFELNKSNASGKFFENSYHHGGCIWIRNPKEIITLVHEVLHAVHYIMRRLRIELREDTEEVFCYYQEWLLKEIALKAKLKL